MTLRSHPGGFTLVELVMSTVVISVIILAMGSTLLIAGRAMPQAGSAASSTMAAADAAEQMTAELRYATAVNQRSTTMIEFKVADRSGDGFPETIRYEWSGTAGAPLTRKYNAGTAVEVLADVREFSLSYDMETLSTEIPQTNESSETLLAQYTPPTDYYDYAIKDSQWFGVYFFPALPANAVSWSVTRVKFQAKQAGTPNGQTRVQLQLPAISLLPTGFVLEEQILNESILPLVYSDCEVPFATVSGLSPQRGLCLVFRWASDADACKLLGQDRNVTAGNLSLVKSTNRGLTWSSVSGQSLLFSIYGKVTTEGAPLIQNTYYLKAVQIGLRAGGDNRSFVQTAARTANTPEVGP